jgi:hypothetical protein
MEKVTLPFVIRGCDFFRTKTVVVEGRALLGNLRKVIRRIAHQAGQNGELRFSRDGKKW